MQLISPVGLLLAAVAKAKTPLRPAARARKRAVQVEAKRLIAAREGRVNQRNGSPNLGVRALSEPCASNANPRAEK
jgi:hypothetical protein